MSSPNYSAILYFIGQHKPQFVGILAVTVIATFLETFTVAAFFPLFSAMLSGSSTDETGILGMIQRLAGVLPFSSPVVAASVLLAVLFVSKTFVNFAMEVIVGIVGTGVLYGVKKHMLERYAAAQYQYFLDNQQGVLLYNVQVAAGAVFNVLTSGVRTIVLLFKVIALIFVLVSILPLGALAVVIVGLGYYGFVHYISKRVSFSLGQRKAQADSEQLVITNEFFSGFRQIITLNVAELWINRFDQANRTSRDTGIRSLAWLAVPRPITELSAVALMIGLILTVMLANPGSFVEILPKVGVFAVALVQLLPALAAIGSTRMVIMTSLPNMDRAYQTLVGPMPMRREGGIGLNSFNKAIVFENLTFAYKEREPILEGVNITFEKGKITAIVGASGAGKTTIVNLILGIFDPTEGKVTVDGVPLQDIKPETWLSRIGSVSQDTFTFHSSVTDNIVFGRNGHSEESIVAAAKVADAHGFISQLPQGYDSVVGDRGMRLSGGQQQRLAIARAMLDLPEILIFDEATSSLDTISETEVKEAITRVSGDRTVIIVAHRLSTISHADKIIVLDNGRVLEEGNHLELLSRNGQYARLANSLSDQE